MITLTEQQYEDLLAGNTRRRNLNAFQKVVKEFETKIEELAEAKGIRSNIITESIRSSARAAFGARVTANIPAAQSDQLRKVINGTLQVIKEMATRR